MLLRKLTDVKIVENRVDAILHTGIFFVKQIKVNKYTFTTDWWVNTYLHEYYEFTPKQNKKLEKLYNRSAYD